jgi:putative holliday junction resolvase
MKILCVDPGEKNIGLAVSDPTGTLARPLTVIAHSSRNEDAIAILEIAAEEKAQRLVVGQATTEDGIPNFSGRKSRRLAAAIRTRTEMPVDLWDESFSTQDAQHSRLLIGQGKKARRGHHDAVAAAIILQSYLDHHLSGS